MAFPKYSILSFLFLLFICSCNSHTKENVKTDSPLIHYQYLQKTSHSKYSNIETTKIRYTVDSLEITGFISKPKNASLVDKYPALIINRGGNRNFGVHNSRSMIFQRYLSSQGYVVLSTQLRGNMFSEGEDEMGGADLDDILKLIDISKSLEYVDNSKIGMYGVSRGGLNAYQISRLSDDIRSFAVVGAPTDPIKNFERRPALYRGVYLPLVGDTTSNRVAYECRTPMIWSNEINEPFLIMHGDEDEQVHVSNALNMIKKLNERSDYTFEYKIFKGGDHGLSTHLKERNSLILDWFKRTLS